MNIATLNILFVVLGAPAAPVGLDYFDDNKVTFDTPKAEEAAAPPPAAPPAATPAPNTEEPGPTPVLEEAALAPVKAPPPRDTPRRPLDIHPPHTGSVAPIPGSTAQKPLRAEDIQVLKVRELTELERQAMEKSLRCSDPLAAEVVMTPRMRALMGFAMKLPAEKLPQRTFWVFSRTTRCFDRGNMGGVSEFDAIDEAARHATEGRKR